MSVIHSAVSQSTNSSWYSRASGDSRSTSGRTQNYWKLFRKEVLAPHHIRILPTVAGEKLPESILTWVEANRSNVSRFDSQRVRFRKLVGNGRGFGSSALFPHEVLPSNESRPFLSRCMVPALSQDALPERMIKNSGNAISKSSLSVPRPSLGCGFASSAFATEEINTMPDFLLASGTTIDFGTGSISTGTALYCPYLSYERVFSQQDYGIEIAANQCAIDGAWAVRALQMLFAKADSEPGTDTGNFMSPISFTCAIDNNVAVLNYHWVDHAQTYCMAPIVKFDFARDDHFNQFLLWTEAIGQWALSHLLPEVKKAITYSSDFASELPALKSSLTKLDKKLSKEEDGLVSALKLNYDNIPWRYDHDDMSPVSSSTASWGSPMVNEAVFSRFEQQSIPRTLLGSKARSVCSEGAFSRPIRVDQPTLEKLMTLPAKSTSTVKLPALPAIPQALCQNNFDENSELVIGKRMSHAMEEIQDLQTQLLNLKQELSGSTKCIQNELSGLRREMTTVIRKDKPGFHKPSSPLRMKGPFSVQTDQRFNIRQGVSVVTTPTDPRPRAAPWQSPKSGLRKPSGLAHELTLDTNVDLATSPSCSAPDSAREYCSAEDGRSPITIFSPTIINVSNQTVNNTFEPENYGEAYGDLVRVPATKPNLLTAVAASHLMSALVPSTLLRVLVLGALIDYCMLSFSNQHAPTVSQYLTHLLQS